VNLEVNSLYVPAGVVESRLAHLEEASGHEADDQSLPIAPAENVMNYQPASVT